MAQPGWRERGAALSGLGGGLQAFGTGAGGGITALLSALGFFSDARLKDNIAPIGALFDGTPVYSFNYIGDRTPRMELAGTSDKILPTVHHTTANVLSLADWRRRRTVGGRDVTEELEIRQR